jgi:4-alpha-glucanotransferase
VGDGRPGDLAAATARAAADGAGFVLLNPLHAVAPGHPVPASPYSPSSRRFVNPLYLRIAGFEELRPASGGELIDYDAVWAAKSARAGPARARRSGATDAARRSGAARLRHLLRAGRGARRNWRDWPEPLRHPAEPGRRRGPRASWPGGWRSTPGCSGCATSSSGRCGRRPPGWRSGGAGPRRRHRPRRRRRLAAAGRAGSGRAGRRAAGRVQPARPGLGAGAWRPGPARRGRLRAVPRPGAGDAAPRRRAAGRPRGRAVAAVVGPARRHRADGTYVRYDARAMVGILALEASRAGAVVVGEDLGTVLPEVTDGLAERNMLGCEVLWFPPATPRAASCRRVVAGQRAGDRVDARPADGGRLPDRGARAGAGLAGPADPPGGRGRAEADGRAGPARSRCSARRG